MFIIVKSQHLKRVDSQMLPSERDNKFLPWRIIFLNDVYLLSCPLLTKLLENRAPWEAFVIIQSTLPIRLFKRC